MPATRKTCPAATARAAALMQDSHETVEAMIRLAALVIDAQDAAAQASGRELVGV